MRVEIRPIEIVKWHGKVKEENFTRPKSISALVDPVAREYATGLSDEEAEEYGIKLGADLSKIFHQDTPHAFWDSKIGQIKLENVTTFLNLENPLEFVKHKVVKASKYVANSMKEYENGEFPEATHVLYDDNEDSELKASRIQTKNRALKLASEITRSKKEQLALIILGKNLKGQSDNKVTVIMDEMVDNDPNEIIRYLTDEDSEILSNIALVKECLQKSILKRKGHKIYFYDSLLGIEDREVAVYLAEVENQDLKIRLLEQSKK